MVNIEQGEHNVAGSNSGVYACIKQFILRDRQVSIGIPAIIGAATAAASCSAIMKSI